MAILYFEIYLVGCLAAYLIFLIGSSLRLPSRNWPGPIVFLWPVLLLWPVYFVADLFLKWKTQRPD
jgi:hypothetical protein